MDKEKPISKLYEEYIKEYKDREVVLGEGNVDSLLMLVGEAPGKEEVRLSRPFVGMAGKNLDEFLNILGMDRNELYITNAIKYRLSKINPKTGRLVNRPATMEEIQKNREYLIKEILIINPRYIVTLGNVPLKAITGENNIKIGDVHGEVRKQLLMDREYKLFPLYHPASIIYDRSLRETYIKDIEKLKKILRGDLSEYGAKAK
ncbi:MAG: uracil-DNA glycosylase [Clostridiaceae bacterium]|nr:uracil-DNA glycosylase [Clostridiaceae bacterium]